MVQLCWRRWFDGGRKVPTFCSARNMRKSGIPAILANIICHQDHLLWRAFVFSSDLGRKQSFPPGSLLIRYSVTAMGKGSKTLTAECVIKEESKLPPLTQTFLLCGSSLMVLLPVDTYRVVSFCYSSPIYSCSKLFISYSNII